jgi:hypothetical protein
MAVKTHAHRIGLLALALVAGSMLADAGFAQSHSRPPPPRQAQFMDRDRAERTRPDRADPRPGRQAEEDQDGDRRMMRRRPEQDAALEMRRSGSIRPLREIEGRVLPRMGGAAYLGPEFDSGSGTYRLKFMRAGSVIWVDVDARTGAVIGRSGR